MKLLTPQHWTDYELLDSGDREKLERFGKYILRRPEPQALWSKSLSEQEWQSKTDARFVQESSHGGKWERKKRMPDQWYISYSHEGMNLKFRLGLTAFKHVGIFPEQAVNWDYIYARSSEINNPKVLNLFAYTGGASLAARAAGADVIHCDSIKNVLNWASANMQASGLSDIRWLLEDALRFVKREAKRGNLYQGVILDPPAWGHGPKGEKWKLEEMANELTESVVKLIDRKKFFLVFNAYSLGYSPMVIENLVLSNLGSKFKSKTESGELYLKSTSGRPLPAGVFVRVKN